MVLKLGSIDGGKHASKRVVGWNTIGQCEIAFEPGALGDTKSLDCDPRIGATNDGTNGNRDDINQRVGFGAVNTWVGDSSKGIIQLIPDLGHVELLYDSNSSARSLPQNSITGKEDAIALGSQHRMALLCRDCGII